MVHSPPSEWAAPCHPTETPIQVHSTPMVFCMGCTTLQQSKWMCLHLQLSHFPLQFRSITSLLLSCEEVQLSIQYFTLRLLIKHAIQQSLSSLTNFHTQHFNTIGQGNQHSRTVRLSHDNTLKSSRRVQELQERHGLLERYRKHTLRKWPCKNA